VEQGRRRNSEVKKFVYSELDKLGFKWIPSHANFLMIDLRRAVKPVIAAMRERSVEVGRVFPALPNFMRVTIGTRPQMETFASTFRKVMS
jgi:histidinol-phosphate aminotransferase